jgi:hypothetical protein
MKMKMKRVVRLSCIIGALCWLGATSATVSAAPIPCGGDCNHDRRVSVDELVRGVTIALGTAALDQCPAFDCHGTGMVTVDCLVAAVGDALDGCPSTVASPTVEGPVSGGKGAPFIASTTFDLSELGYAQAEYFFAGTAAAYTSAAPLSDDGLWSVSPGETAAYKTRLLVYRPLDAARFNGTVIVEWLNVSGGLDAAPDWIMGHTELMRAGFAWVGVSAQVVGVEGGTSIIGLPTMPLKQVDPERYGSLVHPGDSFSYDIFSQAAQAIRRPSGIDILGGLDVARVIAAGESQSAFRLVTYIDAVHPLAAIFDGYFVHSRGSISAPLSEAPQPAIAVPGTAPIRADLDVPVLTFETESDLVLLGYLAARQPDSERFRLWEVAGTSHADTYTVVVGMTDRGDSPGAANLVITTMPVAGFTCSLPLNSGPQHFVVNAALDALDRWVRDGTLPPIGPRFAADPGPPATLVRDAHGNVTSGVRTPQMDVPIATLSGEGQGGSILCSLFGTTDPFDAATLSSLYPDHDTYVSAFNAATDRAVQAGFILPPDAELMKTAAAESDIGR